MTSSAAGFRLRYGAGERPIPKTPFHLEPVGAREEASAPGPIGPVALEERIRTLGAEILSLPVARDGRAGRPGGKERLLFVVSDGTRKTGIRLILPGLVDRLEAAGRYDIQFAIASGLHRRPERREFERLIGPGLPDRFPVILHDPDDPSGLVQVGTTARGTCVKVHRALQEADRTVLTGSVGFHYHAGFSGGRKSIVPGLASRETIVGNHLRTLLPDGRRDSRARAGILDGNPVHEDMAEAASFLPPPFLINTVLTADGRIEGVWSGDMTTAHRDACESLASTRTVRPVPRRLVLVSAGGDPSDCNLVQAHKSFEGAFPALAPGGTLILVAACPDGVGSPDFLAGLEEDSEGDLVRKLSMDYRVYSQTALSWRRKAGSCRLILVSELDAGIVSLAGAEPASSLAAALEMAADRLPDTTVGWIFGNGSRWLVEPAAV